jgi:CHASE3 domain sensor protein|tara:strand:+ start:6721 stop:7197 length:477 start_codon:yes stop_codon:yes gene_type:complete
MEPISTALTGIALVQKSVDFIKKNINTANDIRDIAGSIDALFAGEKQVQQERFGNKSVLGQTKDAAHSVIDAKLAQEQMEEISILIDNRFGYGTWRQIVNERAKRLQEEKERIREEKQAALRRKKEMQETMRIVATVVGVTGFISALIVVLLMAWVEG